MCCDNGPENVVSVVFKYPFWYRFRSFKFYFVPNLFLIMTDDWCHLPNPVKGTCQSMCPDAETTL